MILSLILGVLLGAVSVIFIAQNTILVTISFLGWQFEGSLALVLFLTIICGIIITLLLILPSLIRDAFYLSTLKKQKKDVDDELLKTKVALADISSRLQNSGVTITETTIP
jgi:putative membrane protein